MDTFAFSTWQVLEVSNYNRYSRVFGMSRNRGRKILPLTNIGGQFWNIWPGLGATVLFKWVFR